MKYLSDFNKRYPENQVRGLNEKQLEDLSCSGYSIPSNEDYVNAIELMFYDGEARDIDPDLLNLMTTAWVYNIALPPVKFRTFDGLVNRVLSYDSSEKSDGGK